MRKVIENLKKGNALYVFPFIIGFLFNKSESFSIKIFFIIILILIFYKVIKNIYNIYFYGREIIKKIGLLNINFIKIYNLILILFLYSFFLTFILHTLTTSFYFKIPLSNFNFFIANYYIYNIIYIIILIISIKNIKKIVYIISHNIFILTTLVTIYILNTETYYFIQNSADLVLFIILTNILNLILKKNRVNYHNYHFNIYKKAYDFVHNKKDNKSKNSKELYEEYLKRIDSFSLKGNTIKPIPDEPIGLGNDIFGNENFAKNLYDLINGINFKELKKSYSIGIVGEWGGGKSSIVNLLNQNHLDGNPNFKVINFNPWDYKKEVLVERFFGDLSKILDINNISQLFRNYLQLLGNINGGFKIGIDFLSGFFGSKTMENIRKEIDEKLLKNDEKIIVIIDDLDRCEPDEVILILNLIKNLGNFSNIIYLVSYDKKHIIQVLENKKFNGDYIEKIINIERFIPIPGKEKLKEYFEKEFIKILGNLKRKGKNIYKKSKVKEIIKYLSKEEKNTFHLIKNNFTKRYEYDEHFLPKEEQNDIIELFEGTYNYSIEEKLKIIEKNGLINLTLNKIFINLFEKENLRFIKKLLNQLNIILQLGVEKKGFKKEELSNKGLYFIFIFNYIKMKDYTFFTYILSKKKNLKIDSIKINNSPNMPDILMNLQDKYLYKDFIRIIGCESFLNKEKKKVIFINLNNDNMKLLENFS